MRSVSAAEITSPPTPVASPLRTLRACLFLFRLTLWRQCFSRQTLVNFGLSVLCGLIVAAWAYRGNRTIAGLSDFMLLPAFITFLMPIFAISYGSSTIGGEREDQSLIYLLITPIPRIAVYITKALAVSLLVTAWTIGALYAFCWIAGSIGEKAWPIYWPASVLGSLAYAGVFMLLGAVFRHGTILSLAYWFFLEVLFVQMPGTVKRVTVAYYVRCMLFDAGKEYKMGPRSPAEQEMFAAISGDSAWVILFLATIALTLIGATAFSRREYTELG